MTWKRCFIPLSFVMAACFFVAAFAFPASSAEPSYRDLSQVFGAGDPEGECKTNGNCNSYKHNKSCSYCGGQEILAFQGVFGHLN